MSHLMEYGNGLGTRVLLVAGNSDFSQITAEFVRQHEDLILAGETEGCVGIVRQAVDLQPQVIVIDLDGPGRTCLEAIARLRTALPEVGTIAMALSDGSAYRQAALAAGADELVTKAELIAVLPLAIRRVARAKRPRPGRDGAVS